MTNRIDFSAESTIQGRLQRFFGELGHTWSVSMSATRDGVRVLCTLNKDTPEFVDLLGGLHFATVMTWDEINASREDGFGAVWSKVLEDVRIATGIGSECGIPSA